jgi:hypothetical protein
MEWLKNMLMNSVSYEITQILDIVRFRFIYRMFNPRNFACPNVVGLLPYQFAAIGGRIQKRWN